MAKAPSRNTRSAAAVTPQKRAAADIYDVPESSPEKSRKPTKAARPNPQRTAKAKTTQNNDQEPEAGPSAVRRQSKRISSQPATGTGSSSASKANTGGKETRTPNKSNHKARASNSKAKKAAPSSTAPENNAEPAPTSSRSAIPANRPTTNSEEDEFEDIDAASDISQEDHSPPNITHSTQPARASVIPELDRDNLWGKIVACANDLTQAANYRSKIFKEIYKHSKQLQDAARISNTVDELRDHLTARSDPATKICEQLQDFDGDHRASEAKDFSGGGLKVLVRTISQVIRYHKVTLQDNRDTFLLGIVIDLARSTIEFSDRARGKGIYTRPEISTIANLRLFAKNLVGELQTRQHARGRAAFYDQYEKAHRELKEREDRRMERFRRLNARPPSSLVAVVDLTAPEVALPIHPSAPAEGTAAKAAGTEWSEAMDQELVKGLYEFRDRPASERYLSCLTSPHLQNLSEERIRRRALVCRPSLVAWYEDQDQTAPTWVTSIT